MIRHTSAQHVTSIRPKGISEAISEALKDEDLSFGARKRSDSLASGDTFRNWGGARFGSRLVDCRRQKVSVPAHLAFDPVRRIGGDRGWDYDNFFGISEEPSTSWPVASASAAAGVIRPIFVQAMS
jgi:hypothetical protein